MATTNFVDKQTIIQADWLNDVDEFVYGTTPINNKVIGNITPAAATVTSLTATTAQVTTGGLQIGANPTNESFDKATLSVGNDSLAGADARLVLQCITNAASTRAGTIRLEGTQNGSMIISTSSDMLRFNRGNSRSEFLTGFGYGTGAGAGGAVTQATNSTTSVTLDTVCGQIIMQSVAPSPLPIFAGSDGTTRFTFFNSRLSENSVILLTVKEGASPGYIQAWPTNMADDSCVICVRNTYDAPLLPIINFAVITNSIT